MVDWNSPEQIIKDVEILQKLVHVLAGTYIWEFLTSLSFEWAYLTGRKKFRWPLIFYFLARYLLLGYIIAELIASNVTDPILNCQALMSFITLSSALCSGLSSVNLAIRAIAVWRGSRWVIGSLTVLGLVQWAFILQAGATSAEYTPNAGCGVKDSSYNKTLAQIALTMAFDFAVMILVSYKLAFTARGREKTPLVTQLYRDGLFYFLAVFLMTTMATVVVSIDLSPVMNGIVLTPCAVITTIGACRVVRRLNNFFGDADSSIERSGVVFKLSTRNPTSQMTHVTVTREIDVETDMQPAKESPSGPGGLAYDDEHAFPSKTTGTFDSS